MPEKQTLTKSELAEQCNVGLDKVAQWCNVDYYEELVKLGYTKTQKIFTPRQTKFLMANLIEYSEP